MNIEEFLSTYDLGGYSTPSVALKSYLIIKNDPDLVDILKIAEKIITNTAHSHEAVTPSTLPGHMPPSITRLLTAMALSSYIPNYPQTNLYRDSAPKKFTIQQVLNILTEEFIDTPEGVFNTESTLSQIESMRALRNVSDTSLALFHDIRKYAVVESAKSNSKYLAIDLKEIAHGLNAISENSPLYPFIQEYVQRGLTSHEFEFHANLDERLFYLQLGLNLDQNKFTTDQIWNAYLSERIQPSYLIKSVHSRIIDSQCESIDAIFDCISDEAEGYDLLNRIGSGGSRKVFKAYDRRLKLDLCLKIYEEDPWGPQGKKLLESQRQAAWDDLNEEGQAPNDPESLTDDQIREYQNLQESRVMARINHPNVIRYFGSGTTRNSFPYIVEELIDGSDFAQASKDLSVLKNLFVFHEALKGVEHLHRKRIIHRDIKPENILVGTEGNVYITDLQFAIRTDEPNSSDARYGAMLYAAPDALQHNVPIDERYDIYSLGATLYFALSQDEKVMGDINQLPKDQYNIELEKKLKIFNRGDDYPNFSLKVLRKSLAYDAKDRFDSIESLKSFTTQSAIEHAGNAHETVMLQLFEFSSHNIIHQFFEQP